MRVDRSCNYIVLMRDRKPSDWCKCVELLTRIFSRVSFSNLTKAAKIVTMWKTCYFKRNTVAYARQSEVPKNNIIMKTETTIYRPIVKITAVKENVCEKT